MDALSFPFFFWSGHNGEDLLVVENDYAGEFLELRSSELCRVLQGHSLSVGNPSRQLAVRDLNEVG